MTPVTGFGEACVTPGCSRPRRPAEEDALCALCWELSRLTGAPPSGVPYVVDERAVIAAERQVAHETLLGVAVYAARILKETDGMWPPAARAAACRQGLENIEAECRRVHAAITTDEGDRR